MKSPFLKVGLLILLFSLFPMMGLADQVSVNISQATFISINSPPVPPPQAFSASFLWDITTGVTSDVLVNAQGPFGPFDLPAVVDPTPFQQIYFLSADASIQVNALVHREDFRNPGVYAHDIFILCLTPYCSGLGFGRHDDPISGGVMTVTAVPEPSSLSLVIGASLLLLSTAWRWARRKY
jgi:hypothetical protein